MVLKKEYLARNDSIERSMFAFSMKLSLANKRENINFCCYSWSFKHRNNSLTNCLIIIEFSKCHENAEKYMSHFFVISILCSLSKQLLSYMVEQENGLHEHLIPHTALFLSLGYLWLYDIHFNQ